MNIQKDIIDHWAKLYESQETKDSSFYDDKDDASETPSAAATANESEAEPGYEDVVAILKYFDKQPTDFTLTRSAYDRLDDDTKENIWLYASMGVIPDDEKDAAIALTLDHDRIANFNDEQVKRMHHIDSDGFFRDDEGNPTVTTELAKVMKKNGKLAAFLERGGKVLGDKNEVEQLNKYKTTQYLFVMEKAWKYKGTKHKNENGDLYFPRKTVLNRLGTLDFATEKEAMDQIKIRIDRFCSQYGVDKSKFKKTPAPNAIFKQDPNAVCYVLNEITGEGMKVKKQRGTLAKGATERPDVIEYEKPEMAFFVEYIAYKSVDLAKDTMPDDFKPSAFDQLPKSR